MRTGFILLFMLAVIAGCSNDRKMGTYEVKKLGRPMVIDGNWSKPQWHNVQSLHINNRMGEKPKFKPVVEAKMMYDDQNLYVIFHVNDRYVRCVVTDINGPVYEEPAAEFFFSPDPQYPNRYFNLEINCIGTPLMHYNDFEKVENGKTVKTSTPLDENDIREIEIAHTISESIDPLTQVIDTEITGPVTWTLEYRIPLSMLGKYSKIVHPAAGVEWKANFYKIAEKGNNIHFLTWSPVNNPVPNFHLPPFFGTIIFR
jgi:hypothetical protein